MIVRKPAVANQFYPGDPTRLHYEVGQLMGASLRDEDAIGVVAPHAGYIYSGHVAGAVYSRVSIPKYCIILGPNHTGFGAEISIMNAGLWQMPFGDVPIAKGLADLILGYCPSAEADYEAHIYEHSLEVQVPFLQYRQKALEIVPICLSRLSFEECTSLGHAIGKAISQWESRVLIVTSTDMTHYESQDSAKAKDSMAIERVEALDPKGLYDTVVVNRITMCGFIPTVVMLVAALDLGARRAQLIRYATSGDITGDYRQVVGYAGFIID